MSRSGLDRRRRRHLATAAGGFIAGTALVVVMTGASQPVPMSYDSRLWIAPTSVPVEDALREGREVVWDKSLSPESTLPRASAEASTPVASQDASEPPGAADFGGVEPTGLTIPAMGAQARVIPVGLDEGGGVFVPEDVRTLGWYTASVPIGASQGSSVIVGHRDSAVQGAGTFSGIESLDIGEGIEVTDPSGQVLRYVVTEVMLVDKDAFATVAGEVFTLEGEHRLTLITCGGAFDASARSYESNVFVTAVPDRDA
jgi:LPXTG-site transpeptidase (sortase) family protein